MIKSYILVAFRNIFRNKLFSFVNILGLAFGMGSALLIFLWVNDELNVNRFHAKIDRLYRVMENQQYTDGRLFTFSSTPGPMGPYIKEKFPEIELASRWTWEVTNLFQADEKGFQEKGFYVDQDFIEMFSFPFVAGDVKTALKDNDAIVISEKMAKKFFGNEDPMGKLLTMNTKRTLKVTGVVKDVRKNSSLQFEYLLAFAPFMEENKEWMDQWGNNNIRTFLLLREGANVEGFSAKLKHEVKEHDKDSNTELFIQPFGDVYLRGQYENGVQTGGRIEYVRIFFVVAIFVLVIACINFTNLSTAQATKRAKEVGLRKVIGAVPTQLFRQFMGESFMVVCISALLALLVAFLLIPMFNEITGKELNLFSLDRNSILIFVSVVLFTAFVAGSYPALFMAEFKPVQVLKGQLKSGSRATLFRKGLVVVQFTFSIFLIISTSVVFRQMNYMTNRDIGFDRSNLFSVWMEGDVSKNFETFRTRLLAEPGIESVSASSQLPIDVGNSTSGLVWEGKDPNARILFSNMNVDYDFIQTMKMTMAEGRPFDRNLITDSSNYIVNEKAAAKFGFKNGTAGEDLTMWDNKGKIIGVVKDFNFGSLHSEIEPLVMRIDPTWMNCLLVRAKGNSTEAALRAVEKLCKEYAPAYPFKYSFLDQDWEEFYKAEAQRGKVFNTLAVLSIFISCLGLFGLSAFSAERRTKELGIRKALGASMPGLVTLMSKEFSILVMIAASIGCPVGWWMMNQWLKDYPFHVEVGVITLVDATLICLMVSMLTIAYHSIRVAVADPVKSLRYE